VEFFKLFLGQTILRFHRETVEADENKDVACKSQTGTGPFWHVRMAVGLFLRHLLVTHA
jgi:hypothetical protein